MVACSRKEDKGIQGEEDDDGAVVDNEMAIFLHWAVDVDAEGTCDMVQLLALQTLK